MTRYLRLVLTLSSLLFASCLVAAPKSDTTEKANATKLWVFVDGPVTRNVLVSDDIADALYSILTESLSRQGFKGAIEQVRIEDEKTPSPLLRVSLFEWRSNRMGDVVIRFHAELENNGKTQNLGHYYGSQSAMLRSSFRSLAHMDYTKAAEDACRDLFKDLQKAGL